MFYQVASIYIFQLFFLNTEVFCSSKAEKCPDNKYYNSEINNCTDCHPGYYGPNCSKSCRYPNYGDGCQKRCLCQDIACHHVVGCLDYELTGHRLQLVIGLSVGLGVVLVIVAFLVITVANRRFYTRHIRENAHYIGSVVTEHSMTTNMYKPPESNSRHCSESEAADSGVYMLAGTLRYENMNLD